MVLNQAFFLDMLLVAASRDQELNSFMVDRISFSILKDFISSEGKTLI